MKMLRSVFALIAVLACWSANAQDLTGSISGKVYDIVTGEPLDYASVSVSDRSLYTDDDGRFRLEVLPVGRHTVKVTYMGYEPLELKEIEVGSAHEVALDLGMTPLSTILGEVVVSRPVRNAVNPMAIAGGTKLDMAEASRYAGSLDDPGRLASTVAGISTDVSHNGMCIHGIAPHLMQWRLEGVEIPNPNHYADIATLGGGVLSSLSSFVMGNSDFYAGTSPAQYANALSGVFDMHMRPGSDSRYQHSFQAGVLGLGVASEGPIGAKGGASYILNYRYSATGLLENLGVMDAGGVFNYQDLNFKVNVPTKSLGTFSLWGTMLIDKFKDEPDDPAEWLYTDDGTVSSTDQKMLVAGVGHRIRLGNGLLNTTLAVAHSDNKADMDMALWDTPDKFYKYISADKRYTDIILSSSWLADLADGWMMKVGATVDNKDFDLGIAKAAEIGAPTRLVSAGDGNTTLVTAYTDNVLRLTDRFELGLGLNAMWLALNDKFTVQPRLSLKSTASDNFTLTAATGLYSRMENMDIYYYRGVDGSHPNTDLGFTQAWHNMVAFDYSIGSNLSVRVAPFLHMLVNVPSGANNYSILNQTDFYVDRPLTDDGKGRTYGVDLSLERSLADGWYGNLTASLFNSRYCAGNDEWHDTRFNRKYILNAIGGKEWHVGGHGNNVLSLNGRLTFQGGERYTPIDLNATMAHPDLEVQFDDRYAYSLSHKPMLLFSFSASLRINRARVSHVIAADVLNAGGYNEPIGFALNHQTSNVDVIRQKTFLPNIYYRIEF